MWAPHASMVTVSQTPKQTLHHQYPQPTPSDHHHHHDHLFTPPGHPTKPGHAATQPHTATQQPNHTRPPSHPDPTLQPLSPIQRKCRPRRHLLLDICTQKAPLARPSQMLWARLRGPHIHGYARRWAMRPPASMAPRRTLAADAAVLWRSVTRRLAQAHLQALTSQQRSAYLSHANECPCNAVVGAARASKHMTAHTFRPSESS